MSHVESMQNPVSGFPLEFVNAARVLGRYDATEKEAIALTSIFPRHSHPQLLDLCCGFGRMSAQLHGLGYEVEGLDLSQEQIEMAQRLNPGPHYIVGDMRRLSTERTYDGILNLFTSFGYFETEAEDVAALTGWYAALRPGGILVMELADMELARAKLDRDKDIILRHTGDVVEECIMDWSKRIFRVKYLQRGAEFTCYTRLFEKEALQAHLYQAGFTSVDLYGGLDRRPKRPENNLVVVATK